MKVSRDDGLIDDVPATPRVKQRDNPRSYFRFHPLVAADQGEYKELLAGAKSLANQWRTNQLAHFKRMPPSPPLAKQLSPAKLVRKYFKIIGGVQCAIFQL